MSDDDNRVITIKTRPTARQTGTRKVPHKEYCKTAPSMQDLLSMDRELMISKLNNFQQISEGTYHDIDVGTFIRYLTFDRYSNMKLRLGGILVVNHAPDYWVLRSGAKGKSHITWSVPLKCIPKRSPRANVYFMRKGTPLKSEKQLHGPDALTILTSGTHKLVPIAMIEECHRRGIDLTGTVEGLGVKHHVVNLQDSEVSDYDGEEEEEEQPVRRLNVTLRDD